MCCREFVGGEIFGVAKDISVGLRGLHVQEECGLLYEKQTNKAKLTKAQQSGWC